MKETGGHCYIWLFFLSLFLIGYFAQATFLPALAIVSLCLMCCIAPASCLPLCSSPPFLSSHWLYHILCSLCFVLCHANLACFFLLCKRKWKDHGVTPLHRPFLCIAVLLFSHILCWVSGDCSLFQAKTLLLYGRTVSNIVWCWISSGLWTLIVHGHIELFWLCGTTFLLLW